MERVWRSPLIAGLLTVWFLVIVGSLVTALVLNYTNVQEENFNYFSYTINIVALLIGGWMSGRRSGRRGWYYGAATGLAYAVLVIFIGFLAFDLSPDGSNFAFLAGAVVIAAFGGMLGVNTRTGYR